MRKVFFVSPPKTGSVSFCRAIGQLGWSPIHDYKRNFAAANTGNWGYFDNTDAYADGLDTHYEALYDHFPRALFYYSHRPIDDIIISGYRHRQSVGEGGNPVGHLSAWWWGRPDEHARRLTEHRHGVLSFFDDKPGSLVVAPISDGWLPLCSALDVDPPGTPWPHRHTGNDQARATGAMDNMPGVMGKTAADCRRLRSPAWLAGMVPMTHDLRERLGTGAEMVEVGTHLGESAAIWAASGIFDRITCVDLWHNGAARMQAANTIRAMGGGVVRSVKGSLQAAGDFGDGSLDFVYLDAGHTEEDVRRDIGGWLPKIREGGAIGGHDYGRGWEGVKKAVDAAFGKPDKVYPDTSWVRFL